MSPKIIIEEGEYGATVYIGEYQFTLVTLLAFIETYNKHAARAQDICRRYGLGKLGDNTIEVCLTELERLKFAEEKRFNGI